MSLSFLYCPGFIMENTKNLIADLLTAPKTVSLELPRDCIVCTCELKCVNRCVKCLYFTDVFQSMTVESCIDSGGKFRFIGIVDKKSDMIDEPFWCDFTKVIERLRNVDAERSKIDLQPQVQIEFKIPEELQRTIDKTSENISELTHYASTFSALSEALTNFLTAKSLTNYYKTALQALALFLDVVVAIMNKSYAMLPSILMQFAALVDLAYDSIATIMVWFQQLVFPDKVCEGNTDIAQDALVHLHGQGYTEYGIGSLLCGIVGTMLFGILPDVQRVKRMSETMRLFNIIVPTSDKIGEFLFQLVEFLPKIISEWIKDKCPAEWWLTSFAKNQPLYEWAQEVYQMNTKYYRDQCSFSAQIQKRVVILRAQGMDIMPQAANMMSVNGKAYNFLNSAFKIINDLHKVVTDALGTRGSKKTPFCIYFTGEPGLGKSVLTTWFALKMCPQYVDQNNKIYTRNGFMKHWDGYTGQYAVVLNDFAQSRGGATDEDEYAQFINMMDSVEYRIPFAALEEKGGTFNSKLVMVSSNCAYPKPNTINCHEAIWRRRNLVVQVHVKPQFLNNGKLNTNLIPDDQSHFYFTLLDPRKDRGNNIIRENVTFDQLCTLVKDKFNEHKIEVNKLDNFYAMANNSDTSWDCDLGYTSSVLNVDDVFPKEDIFFDTHTVLVAQMRTEGGQDTVSKNRTRVEMLVDDISYEMRVLKQKWLTENARSNIIIASLSAVVGFIGFLALFYTTKMFSRRKEKDDLYENVSRGGDNRSTYKGVRLDEDVLYDSSHLMSQGVVPSGDFKTRKLQTRVVRAQGLSAQSADVQADNLMRQRILPYLCYVRVFSTKPQAMHGIMVKGKMLLVPMHLFIDKILNKFIEDDTKIEIHIEGRTFEIPFNKKHMCRIDGKDAVMYFCGPIMRSFRDNIQHFISDKDLNSHQKFPASFITTTNDGIPLIHNVNVVGDDHPHADSYEVGNQVFYTRDSWWYKIDSVDGDCGAPLIAQRPTLPRKIIGIHTAGNTSSRWGVGQLITKEMLERALASLPYNVEGIPYPVEPGSIEKCILVPEGQFSIIGSVPDKFAVRQPDKTDIIPSVLYDKIFSHTTEPSVLSPRDKRCESKISPLVKGCMKYGLESHPVKIDILERVKQSIIEDFERLKDATDSLSLLSDEEMINGNSDDYIDSVNMQSSPGWPYIITKPKQYRGKEYLFYGDVGFRKMHKELQDRYDFRYSCAKLGKRSPSLWTDCLKDERRKLAKIQSGDTRAFTIPPVDFTLLCRKFTGNFSRFFYRNRLKMFSCVGINPQSLEWTIFVESLLQNSELGFAGDYEYWDGTMLAQFMHAVCEIINAWYGDSSENCLIREVLFDEMIHTVQLMINTMYITHHGGPSGNPLTVIINTIVNEMYLRYCWFDLAPMEYNSIVEYHKNIKPGIYGDDNAVSVKPEVSHFYNMVTIANLLKQFGIRLTMADKTSTVCSLTPIVDFTFLKQGFRKVGNFWLPLMSENTIKELINWIRTCDDEILACQENVNSALQFCYFYGSDYFQEFRSKLIKAIVDCNVPIVLHDIGYFKLLFTPLDCDNLDNYVHRMSLKAQMDTSNVKKGAFGIRFEDERELDVQQASAGNMVVTSNRAEKQLNDISWNLQHVVNRPSFVQTLTWDTTQTFGTNLSIYSVPYDLLKSTFIQMPFQNFNYWRGSVKVRFQMNSTRFHVGTLIVYYVPLTNINTINNWHARSLPAKTSVQHVLLDAASSTVAELEIPFVSGFDYLNIPNMIATNKRADSVPPFNYLGYIYIEVLNQLLAATGAPPKIDISVFMQLGEDSTFKVPTSVPNIFIGGESSSFIDLHPQGNTITSVSNFKNYGRIAQATVPTNITGDAFDIKSNVSGMDKPSMTIQPMPWYRKAMQYLSHSIDTDVNNRLCLESSGVNVCDFEHFGTSVDEMDMKFLLTKVTLDRIVSWNATDNENTIIAFGVVGPCDRLLRISNDDFTTPFYLNLVDFVSSQFRFWRGGYKIRIRIAASQFHSGRLFLGYHPGTYTPPTSLNTSFNQYGVVIDLQNMKRDWEFVFPFLYPLPWARVCNESINFTTPVFQNFFTGCWSLRVLNNLVTAENAPPNAYVNLYFGGADDFEVAYPSLANTSIIQQNVFVEDPLPPDEELILRSQGVEDDGISEKVDDAVSQIKQEVAALDGPELAPLRAYNDKNNKHFGESYRSLRDLFKRYVMLFSEDVLGTKYFGPQNGISFFPVCLPFSSGLTPATPNFNPIFNKGLLGWFSPMYRVWRGSMRYKIVITNVPNQNTNAINSTVTFDPNFYDVTGLSTAVIDAAFGTFIKSNFSDRELGNYTVFPVSYPVDNVSNSILAISGEQVRYGTKGLAYDVAYPTVPVHDIEVPFQTAYNILPVLPMVDINYATGAQKWSRQKVGNNAVPGTVFVAFLASPIVNVAPGTVPTQSIKYGNYNLYQSAGDDFRVGLFVGPLPVLVYRDGSYSNLPDAYGLLSSAEARIKLHAQGKDDDNVHITISKYRFGNRFQHFTIHMRYGDDVVFENNNDASNKIELRGASNVSIYFRSSTGDRATLHFNITDLIVIVADGYVKRVTIHPDEDGQINGIMKYMELSFDSEITDFYINGSVSKSIGDFYKFICTCDLAEGGYNVFGTVGDYVYEEAVTVATVATEGLECNSECCVPKDGFKVPYKNFKQEEISDHDAYIAARDRIYKSVMLKPLTSKSRKSVLVVSPEISDSEDAISDISKPLSLNMCKDHKEMVNTNWPIAYTMIVDHFKFDRNPVSTLNEIQQRENQFFYGYSTLNKIEQIGGRPPTFHVKLTTTMFEGHVFNGYGKNKAHAKWHAAKACIERMRKYFRIG